MKANQTGNSACPVFGIQSTSVKPMKSATLDLKGMKIPDEDLLDEINMPPFRMS